MPRLSSTPRGFAVSPLRAAATPVATTLLGSACSLLPFIAEFPLFPDTGLLMALGWRLLLPELWPARAALGLGLANDLIVGLPLGQSAAIWTVLFLLCDLADRRLDWRSYWIEWAVALPLFALAVLGGWLFALAGGSGASLALYLPQLVTAIMLFPLAVRLCAALDRWRLNL